MAIGTSQGAFYEDQFHYSQSQWDPKYDDNEITPNKQRTDKALEGAELDPSTGLGIEISDKHPTPDYMNPPEGNAIQDYVKGVEKDISNAPSKFIEDMHKSALKTDAQRTDEAINIGLAAGPGTMAGVASKTADVASRMKAAVMEAKGIHPETIRQETGWSKSSDGRARYEISDEGMKLVDKDWKFGETGKLPDFIEHPDLFKAYPHLKDMNFEVAGKDFPYIGGFNSASNTMTVNPSRIVSGDEGLLDVISHELQHAVQNKEGFAKGSNPELALEKSRDVLRSRIKEWAETGKGDIEALSKSYKDLHGDQASQLGEYIYQRAPGEVEANNTMARRKLTDQQRKSFSPEDTKKLLEGSTNSITGGKYMPEIDLSGVF